MNALDEEMYILDFLFIKTDIYRIFIKLPLVEIFSAEYIPSESNETVIALKGADGKVLKQDREQFKILIIKSFCNASNNISSIGNTVEDFVIQPKGFPKTEELKKFLEKYPVVTTT